MSKKEEYWSDIALQVELEKEAQAKAEAAAQGNPPPPPLPLGELVRLSIDAFSRNKGVDPTKVDPKKFVENMRFQAGNTYENAVNSTAQNRHEVLSKLYESGYKHKPVDVAKRNLDEIWKYATDKKITPKDLITSPSELQHSAVAMELVTRLTVDQFGNEQFGEAFVNNPKLWFEEVARAYQSIDFTTLSSQEEAEIRKVFAGAFHHMREEAAKLPEGSISFPKDDEQLWEGVGDYYFSSQMNNDPAYEAQRRSLRAQLKNLQAALVQPNTAREEADILKTARKDLQDRMNMYPDLVDDVRALRSRMTREMEELNRKPEGGEGRGKESSASAVAKASEKLQTIQYEKPQYDPAGFGLAGIEEANKAFYDPANPNKNMGARSQLHNLFNIFNDRDGYDRFRGTEYQQGKLRNALEILNGMERSQGLDPDQLQYIENFKNSILSRMESLQRVEDAPNRIYLTREEEQSAKYDPIGTVEGMFNELAKAFNEDPNGPLAEFYMDRMQLLQYYIFSKRHGVQTANIDVVVVESKEEFLNAVASHGTFKGEHWSPDKVANWQEQVEAVIKKREQAGIGEKKNFERSYINRFHEILFIQQWKHADSAANENFQKFLNSRMQEDDFWNMDGQFGGLLDVFRQTLARKYETQLFDAKGDRNAHIDRFWDNAIKETIKELKGPEYSDYRKIWERYLNGEFFMDAPDADTGGMATLRRKAEANAASVPQALTYEDACEMMTLFASYRMIMSQEKTRADLRFLPVRWGKEIGEFTIPDEFFNKDSDAALLPLEFRTQFYEKQKLAKLANPFEAWMITWGGITSGMTGEEQLMMRRRAEILRKQIPEIDVWGQEWAEDWWNSHVKPLKDADKRRESLIQQGKKGEFKLNADEKRSLSEMKALFSFAETISENPSLNKTEDEVWDWIRFMDKKKLQNETTFYGAMRAGAMENGLTFYMGVSESGARRAAQFGALSELLDGNKDVTRQNFLTFVDLDSSRGYFQSKLNKDTMANKISFLGEQAFLSKYAPHARLLALREGESFAVRDWMDKNCGGKQGFGPMYERLARYQENIHEELALEQQIDYSKGLAGLTGRQREAVDTIFKLRHKADSGLTIEDEKKNYFTEMQKISDFLLKDNVYQSYTGAKHVKIEGSAADYGAIKELTDIRYGQILIGMRRDDYKYKWVQNPDRALSKLMAMEGHTLYRQEYVEMKNELHTMQQQFQSTPSDQLARDIAAQQTKIREFTTNMLRQISEKSEWRARYLTTASDKFEPKYAQDEQSGLWRRNWRDVGAAATWWDLTGDRWSLDPQTATKAWKQTYKMIVGVNGNDIAMIHWLLDEGQQLLFQEVYPKYGQWGKWMYNSSDQKKIYPHKESRLADDLWHQHEVDSEAVGGRAAYTARGAMGIENALKDTLRVSYYNRIGGGMVGREEKLASIHKAFPWTKKYLTEDNIDNVLEWADHTIPLPIVWQKIQIFFGIATLFMILYTIQSAGSGEEKKKSH